jgi:hypothetical protein
MVGLPLFLYMLDELEALVLALNDKHGGEGCINKNTSIFPSSCSYLHFQPHFKYDPHKLLMITLEDICILAHLEKHCMVHKYIGRPTH